MEATRRLEIELPEDLADVIADQVRSGRFASESEVVGAALTLLFEQDDEEKDPAIEAWLRETVVPRYEKWKASGEKGKSVDEVRASLEQRRVERELRDAAE